MIKDFKIKLEDPEDRVTFQQKFFEAGGSWAGGSKKLMHLGKKHYVCDGPSGPDGRYGRYGRYGPSLLYTSKKSFSTNTKTELSYIEVIVMLNEIIDHEIIKAKGKGNGNGSNNSDKEINRALGSDD